MLHTIYTMHLESTRSANCDNKLNILEREIDKAPSESAYVL